MAKTSSLYTHLRRIAEFFDQQGRPEAQITAHVTRRTLMSQGGLALRSEAARCSSVNIA